MGSQAPLDIPRTDTPLADTHAHLDMLEDPAGALARAAFAGVSFVITVADPTADAERTLQELGAWRSAAADLLRVTLRSESANDQPIAPPEVRVIVGAHPHNAKDFDDEARARLSALAGDPLVAGIGEIGLDYHYDHSPRGVQREAFAEQLETAKRLRLPAIVHLREAHVEGEAIMRSAGIPAQGCVLHCFTGDSPMLDPFLEMGCYVSFAGPVTFKKADPIREAVVRVPLDRLLVETDCPFMAPEPYRGRQNEPGLAVFTASRIADARGIGLDELCEATSANARRVFST